MNITIIKSLNWYKFAKEIFKNKMKINSICCIGAGYVASDNVRDCTEKPQYQGHSCGPECPTHC